MAESNIVKALGAVSSATMTPDRVAVRSGPAPFDQTGSGDRIAGAACAFRLDF